MSSSLLADHLTAIATQRVMLECPSPIQAGAFYYGYVLVVPGLSWLGDMLDARVAGPEQARAWTRSYLADGDVGGLARVLSLAVDVLRNSPRSVPVAADNSPDWFIDGVVRAVEAKRPATVLGETTVAWLYNFGLGAETATADYFKDAAAERAARLVRFERWVQDYYESPGTPWQRILRAYEGPGERAVYRFVELWKAHLEGAP